MDFQLQPLALRDVVNADCDLLVVLLPQSLAHRIHPQCEQGDRAPTTASADRKSRAGAFRDAQETPPLPTEVAEALGPVLAPLLREALVAGDWDASPAKALALYRASGFAARRVLLLGAGEADSRDIRKALAAATTALKAEGCARAVISLAALEPAAALASIAPAVQCAAEAAYTYTLTRPRSKPASLESVSLAPAPQVLDGTTAQTAQATLAQARATALGQSLAREWGNRPANHATPSHLAHAAQELTGHRGVTCKVLGPQEVQELSMGAFLAVAQGSSQPLRFIELHYRGSKTAAQRPPVVLVGKGVTFDSGGISIKPAAAMDEMKFDMCGAASVLGVFRALAELQPEHAHVVGLIAACENLPSGTAVKPGDVITSMDGQTIEILNTDAEGRLLLCDALTYARRFNPAALVDIATLTGACVIALGGVRSGLYANTDALAHALEQAGQRSGDLCWRMPLDEDYAEGLKSNFADLANVAGRQAGSVTAAKFLQSFVSKDTPWAHLDIAGTAWKEGKSKGATGRPVPLLVDYLLHVSAQAEGGAVADDAPVGKDIDQPAVKKATSKNTARTSAKTSAKTGRAASAAAAQTPTPAAPRPAAAGRRRKD